MRTRTFAAAMLVLCMAGTPVLARAANTGQAVYEESCARCHSSAFGSFFSGAPKRGGKEWPARLQAAGSIDGLARSVVSGKGKMPARGGAPSSVSDADLKAATEYLVNAPPAQ